MKKDDYIFLINKCLKGEHTAAELEALDAWTAASAANRKLREQLEEDWRRNVAHRPSLEEKPKAVRRSLPVWRRWLSVASIASALVLAALWWSIRDSGPVELLLVETGVGERRSVTLTDGTVVALNEKSRLRYPETFAAGERKVELEGEGFFEVTEKETAPFVIKTRLADVRVLGTSFNLEAMPNRVQLVIEVMRGKVEVIGRNRPDPMVLRAGQKGVVKEQGNNEMDLASPNAGAWRNRVLQFNDQVLGIVLLDLKKVYGVSVRIDGLKATTCRFSGRFQGMDIQTILQNIANTFGMQIEKVSANKYSLKGGQCNGAAQ
ncbi:MAG: FecR domain-containing protein [Bacteroidota bacterium]